MHGAALDDHALDALHRQTDGWPAALSLAVQTLRSLRSPTDITAVPESRSQLMQFLVEETLAQQPELAQEMLLRTSIMREFSAGLAAALVDEPAPDGCQELIDRLIQAEIFLEPSPDRPEWVRFQPLFHDMLRRASRPAPFAERRRGPAPPGRRLVHRAQHGR